jgi:predicted acylesterase/phospholipase RssA
MPETSSALSTGSWCLANAEHHVASAQACRPCSTRSPAGTLSLTVAALSLAAALGAGRLAGQQTPPPAATAPAAVTPSAALVLGGGSSRGIAHAGALVALEELGYDAAVVVGTSMGAIIGALYAAGYTPDEIRRVTSAEPWLERFSARPLPLGPGRLPVRPLVELGIGGRFHQGLLPATGVNLRLVELLFDAGVRARNDFDLLPRRFRAVATDLADGREVVLGSGDLPRAVRASMAVPGAFAAIPWDGRVLVDGGIANNLPVSVARRLTDLPVLAVDVLQPPAQITERSAVDLAVRALRLLIENARPDDNAQPDVLIVPRLPAGFAETRFPTDASRLLRSGYDAVLEELPPVDPAGGPAPRRVARLAPARVDSLRIHGGDRATRRLATELLLPALGAYDADRIVRRVRALYETGLFQAVWPRIDFPRDDDGTATLVVELVPAPRSVLAAAMRLDNDIGAGGWALLRHHLSLGQPIEINISALLDERRRHAHADAAVFSTLFPGVIWIGGVSAAEERIHVAGRRDVAPHRLRRTGGWIGAETHGAWFISLLLRGDRVVDEDRDVAGWSTGPLLRVAPAPPLQRVAGLDPFAEIEMRFGDFPYHRAHIRAGVGRTIGGNRAALFVDAGATSSRAPADAMPATTRELTPWLAVGALRAPARVVLGIDLARPLWIDGFARVRLRSATAADRWEDFDTTKAWHAGGEVGVVWPTVIGSFDIGAAAGTGARWRFNVGVGASF